MLLLFSGLHFENRCYKIVKIEVDHIFTLFPQTLYQEMPLGVAFLL